MVRHAVRKHPLQKICPADGSLVLRRLPRTLRGVFIGDFDILRLLPNHYARHDLITQ
ncbi:hypothetical protein Poly30_50750 [Planctomycetes bacterium Poly30]|uniref:Uncharacterized protein n=1 Tax=Saltatorellus ferox TaxID=2528018 RepID=A0A518EZJ7_9BACT|nr:hypothetical protein Poly30_50750 [Planctomycetes bacterium Poly30]